MNWTGFNNQDRTRFEAWYASTTLFKERYSYTYVSDYEWYDKCASTVGYLANQYRITYGFCDAAGGGICLALAANNQFAEMSTTDGIEIYAFKDGTTPSHFLINVFGENSNGDLVCLHSGTNSSGTDFAYITTENHLTAVSVIDYTTAANTINNSYGNDYIVQPLYAADEPTPFYVVSGNTELAVFTVIQVQTKKFMVVGKGICVEVE